MRNLKTITTQDHVIHVIDSTELSDDIVCGDEVMLQESLTNFCVEGSRKNFSKDTPLDNWTLVGETNSPSWNFGKPNILVGTVSSTPTLTMILFVSKNRLESSPRPSYMGSINVEEIDRESFVELGVRDLTKKANLTTYETEEMSLDDMVPDDVIIEE